MNHFIFNKEDCNAAFFVPYPYKHPRCTSLVYKQSNFDISILEEIAQGVIELPIDDAEKRLYVMQEQLYKLVKTYPDLVMHSANLQQFIYNNQWTSMDFIHFAGKYLAEGNISVVETLLGAWPGTEELDENYRIYFDWMIRIAKDPEWSPDEDQMNRLYELANRCPIKSGLIVYAFRNLYNTLTNRINRFEETCGGELARGTQPQGFIRLHQPKPAKNTKPLPKINTGQLSIYPNPADKQINISCKNAIQVEVTNVFGTVAISKNVRFHNVVDGLFHF